MFLVDTDVLIDCLRGTAAARRWLEATPDQEFGVPGVVAMELLIGCRNRTELDGVQRFLSAFAVLWPEAPDCAQAYALLATHRLASAISIPDCLVAAMALRRTLTLYTFNRKHFQVIPGLDVREPYARS